MSGHQDVVNSIAVAPVNGRATAVSAGEDGEMRVWDLGRMRLYGQGLVGPEKGAESIAVLYDNGCTTVVSGHWDGTLWAWNP